MSRPALEVADILRAYAGRFLERSLWRTRDDLRGRRGHQHAMSTTGDAKGRKRHRNQDEQSPGQILFRHWYRPDRAKSVPTSSAAGRRSPASDRMKI